MLKINQIFTKLFFAFVVAFLIFFVTTYFSLKLTIIGPAAIDVYNEVWIKLGIASIFILIIVYLTVKSMSYKLLEDVEHFQDYLEEISNKNYQAVVKIKYFHDFLEMSLRLKNIIKRLNNKDSKKK